MPDSVTRLKRRLRDLERSRRKWKERSAAQQRHIRYLRVKTRDLSRSRDHWRARSDRPPAPAPTPPPAPPVFLPLPAPREAAPVGEA